MFVPGFPSVLRNPESKRPGSDKVYSERVSSVLN